MQDIWDNHRGSIIAVAAAIIAFFSSAYVVSEEEQAVIIRTGQPVGTVNTPGGKTGAGLYLRIPFVDSVQTIEKRLLDLEMNEEEVLSNDQQRLLVDAYARFRIVDPVRMVERAGNTDGVRTALEPILNSVLRQELGRRTFEAMLTAERGTALANVRTKLDRQAKQYGAEIIDVQIKRTDLPSGAPLDSAFQRMETDRQREARTIRAQGDRDARIIRAEADAQASKIYAAAFGKDPGFYDFYRAMQSYDATFATREGGPQNNLILSPDNEYLRQFRGQR
ncbi:protease modulator HflC [Parerythrobacter lacustris]|uniref:Protease modulator HflC n=1 Tax=Parerythrobacter lacustris TaxID=2969984 RepID=A0ABT1XU80_9SPHN|nr:protease modulator HflC [Parerythrobacter lacustris]MCR2835218.1 protease modulator HflC [Parerythrobacter lacustris]